MRGAPFSPAAAGSLSKGRPQDSISRRPEAQAPQSSIAGGVPYMQDPVGTLQLGAAEVVAPQRALPCRATPFAAAPLGVKPSPLSWAFGRERNPCH